MRGPTGSHLVVAKWERMWGHSPPPPFPCSIWGQNVLFLRQELPGGRELQRVLLSKWGSSPASPDDFSQEKLQKMGGIPGHSGATVPVPGASQGSAHQGSVFQLCTQ